MEPLAKIFLDTSALFAGIWSESGGSRQLLRLGEAGVVQLLVSGQVLTEIERGVRRKVPERLPALILLLDRIQLEIVPDGSEEIREKFETLVAHSNDARVIAAAAESTADFFVSLDQRHFLCNENLRTQVPFSIGTPGDCLAWLRRRIQE